MRRVLLGAVISIIYGILPSIWPNIQQSWDVYAICKHVEIFSWLIVLLSFIPYRQLRAKSVVIVLAVIEFFDIFTYLFWYLCVDTYYVYCVKSIICLYIIVKVWWRDYDKSNDELDENHFFIVGIRPVGFQDFILSLVKEPVGGVGVYAKGEFYHYRHGKLQVHDRRFIEKLRTKYKIIKMRRIDSGRLSILRSLPGSRYSKWSLQYNCKTVLEPILGKRGKPLFYRKGVSSELKDK